MSSPSDSPLPIRAIIDEGDAEAFLPYAPIGELLEHVPVYLRPELLYHQARMALMPNSTKLYLHVPWAAQHLFRLNDAIMRDERSKLDEHLKYRLALIASRDNQCEYCTAHCTATLKERWGYEDGRVESVLRLQDTVDEREAVATEFVHQASLDPVSVTDELRSRLTEHFDPEEVMEIVLVMGLWKMYNAMHSAMGLPVEDPVTEYTDRVRIPAVPIDESGEERE